MPATNDYYKALGVARGASEDEVRKAHRRLVRKYHPDVNPGDKSAETRFKEIQEAYDILSDPKKKQMYDQYGFYSENGFPQGGAGGYPPPGMDFSGFDFSDILSQMGGAAGAGKAGARGGPQPEPGGGAFKDIFSQFFGKGGAPGENRRERGADLEYSLNVDFWQAIKGAQVRLNITRQEACATCGGAGNSGGKSAPCAQCAGSGQVSQVAGKMRFNLSCPRCGGSGRLVNACPTCSGEGVAPRQDPVEVRIPQGVWNGDRLRVAGKGNAASKGVPAGDLFITIRVDAHSFFRREGDNIEITLPVTVAEAGLGAEIEVPTIDGRARLKVPQGTESGKRFRLREKGVFNARKNTRGDQIVEISVQTPKVENVRVRELLRELAQLDLGDPRAALWDKV